MMNTKRSRVQCPEQQKYMGVQNQKLDYAVSIILTKLSGNTVQIYDISDVGVMVLRKPCERYTRLLSESACEPSQRVE